MLANAPCAGQTSDAASAVLFIVVKPSKTGPAGFGALVLRLQVDTYSEQTGSHGDKLSCNSAALVGACAQDSTGGCNVHEFVRVGGAYGNIGRQTEDPLTVRPRDAFSCVIKELRRRVF